MDQRDGSRRTGSVPPRRRGPRRIATDTAVRHAARRSTAPRVEPGRGPTRARRGGEAAIREQIGLGQCGARPGRAGPPGRETSSVRVRDRLAWPESLISPDRRGTMPRRPRTYLVRRPGRSAGRRRWRRTRRAAATAAADSRSTFARTTTLGSLLIPGVNPSPDDRGPDRRRPRPARAIRRKSTSPPSGRRPGSPSTSRAGIAAATPTPPARLVVDRHRVVGRGEPGGQEVAPGSSSRWSERRRGSPAGRDRADHLARFPRAGWPSTRSSIGLVSGPGRRWRRSP